MLNFLFIVSVATAFYRLGASHKKPGWLYGLIGGGSAYVFVLISGALVVLFAPESLSSHSNLKSAYKLLFLALAFAGLLCWLLYSLLEHVLKKEKASRPKAETLDEYIEEEQ